MLKALLLSYRSHELKAFINKVLGKLYFIFQPPGTDEVIGLDQTLADRAQDSSLALAQQLFDFLLDHADIDDRVKDLIRKYQINPIDELLSQILPWITNDLINEFESNYT